MDRVCTRLLSYMNRVCTRLLSVLVITDSFVCMLGESLLSVGLDLSAAQKLSSAGDGSRRQHHLDKLFRPAAHHSGCKVLLCGEAGATSAVLIFLSSTRELSFCACFDV